MPTAPDVPQVLPFRLERGRAVGLQLGCSLISAMVLLGLGSVILFYGSAAADKWWLAWLVGGGFCLLGTLFLWSWITQLFAAGTPVPVVELSDHPVKAGVPFKLALVQPGPAMLRSIRVKVICQEVSAKVVTKHMGKGRAPRRTRMVTEKIRHEEILVEAREVRVLHGDVWQQVYDLALPAGVPATAAHRMPQILWKLEVDGRMNGPGRYQQTFELKVTEA
jgi:hypothetical protein